MSTHLMNTYTRQPVAFVRGEGAYLWDESGKQYLDAVAGVAVNGLGHAHPRLVKAISEQAANLMHTSNLYRVLRQEELAERLCE
ncbi:MAG: aminotransferase class III-fold pyridoxal phosphate-dependent enzyme, partial [Thiobacillus sp.]